MTVLAVERLPANASVTNAVLLQAAISPRYDLSAALARAEQGIWNFRSVLDVLFVGIGTSVAGTVDGRYTPGSGMLGFQPPANLTAEGEELYATRLHDVPFHPKMCAAFHFGGHMGSTNRVFVSERIAPLLRETTKSM